MRTDRMRGAGDYDPPEDDLTLECQTCFAEFAELDTARCECYQVTCPSCGSDDLRRL